MKLDNIPQDNIKTFRGEKKAIYGISQDNKYTTAASSGWIVEEIVTSQALSEFERLAQAALVKFQAGEASPIEYHMYKNKFDLATLAQYMKTFPWIIKRHFQPKHFKKISPKILKKYSELFNVSEQELLHE